MCGIVGYIGGDQAVPVLLNGLSKLEYRGYAFGEYNSSQICAFGKCPVAKLLHPLRDRNGLELMAVFECAAANFPDPLRYDHLSTGAQISFQHTLFDTEIT